MAGKITFNGSITGFFYEYVLCRAVKAANEELPEGQRLKKSQVVAMRSELERRIRAGYKDKTAGYPENVSVFGCKGISPAMVQSELASVLADTTGRNDLEVVTGLRAQPPAELAKQATTQTMYEWLTDYAEMTGAELKFGPNKGQKSPDRPMLPLSPYMPGLVDRDIAMKNGNQVLYMTDAAVSADYADLGFLNEGVTLSVASDPAIDVPSKLREAGPALSADDRSGLSALRPFMSEREYRELSVDGWTQNGGIVRGEDGKNHAIFMDDASIARVREVVRSLREQGTSFTLQRDRRRGQVKAHFDNGMDVRVIDPYMPAYAGSRCYDDGVSVYYQMDGHKNPDGSKARGWTEYVPQSPAECLDLINFALGREVARWDKPGQQVGAPEVVANGTLNTSFHASKNFRARVGVRRVDGQLVNVSIFHNGASRSSNTRRFEDEASAEDYLVDAIATARENLAGQIGVESLIELARQRQEMLDKAEELGDEELREQAATMVPGYSYNPDVKAIQEKYWDVLTVPGTNLYRPDVAVEDIGESAEDNISLETLDANTYVGNPESICRQHLADELDFFIGRFDKGEDGLRFDPVNVSKFMTSAYGIFRNNDDLTAAMRKLSMNPEELRGSDYYTNVFKGRLIRFDEKTAQPLKGYVGYGADGSVVRDGFMGRMFDTIKQSIESNGCTVNDDDILIDAHGIVQYRASRVESMRPKGANKMDSRRPRTVTGQIGQLFPPDSNGVVNAGDHLFVPGYLARIEPNKDGENKPYEDRMVLDGYEQVLRATIQDTVRRDLMVSDQDEIGLPYSLNNAVRKLYDTRYGLDFYSRTAEGGMSDELRQAIIDTNKSRVRLDRRFMDESGRMALFQARRRPGFDPLDDYRMDAITLTDGRNPAVMEAPGDGLFDPFFTGNGGAQGVRYLVDGASVTPDGHIVPSLDKDARCAMMNYLRDSGRYPDFDAVDRMNMTGNGLLHGLRETEPVGMAQVSLSCMTFEDGIVVSKAFAETHMVARQSDGAMRPLMIGDKMECHGNKGVIGAIIDPEMSDEEAAEKGVWNARDLFRANPELQVVMSPYSSVSRFNAGMGVEAIRSNPSDLTMPDGTVHKGSVGYVKMTILEQTADKKTHFSEDGTQKRAYGAQLVWALASNDCTEVLKDSFQDNYKSLANLRELLITCGMDIDPTGRFQRGYHKQDGEERQLFEMGPLMYTEYSKDGVAGRRLNMGGMKQEFGQQVNMMGGFMEVPFPVRLPTGDTIPEISDEERSEASKAAYAGKTYRMPVMSAYLRSGQELDDGESVVHDYTNSYLAIYEAAVRFQDATDQVATLEAQATRTKEDEAKLAKLRAVLERAPGDAQAEYSKIADDVVSRRFQGKRNYFRTNMMSNKQSRSATAIWSPDPQMAPDSIGMNPEMALVLGIAEKNQDGVIELKKPDDSYVLMHRDPVIMPSGVRYLKTVLREDAVGITINPACVGGYQGDFDGDTIGVHVPHSSRAKREAMDRLSIRANLLDKSMYDPETDRYKLFIAGGQDIAAAWAADPRLKADYEALEERVNLFEDAYKRGKMNKTRLNEEREQAVMDIAGYLYDCAEASFGRHVISYESPEAHIKSIEAFVDDKAKGSLGKVQDYAKFMGLSYETEDDGHLKDGTGVQRDGTLASRDAHIGILKAKNMQQQYTGAAGQYSIRAVKTLLNVNPAAATTLNALATQGVLQVKHSPVQADRFEHLMTGCARDVWHGYALEESREDVTDLRPVMDPVTRETRMESETVTVDSWKTVLNDERKPVMATKEQFVQQFMDVYGSSRGMGLDVNLRMVEDIADACSKDGVMMDIEGELCEKYAAPMQQLAYGGTFETIMELADKQAKDPEYPGLFESMPDSPHDYNGCLADGTVMAPNLELKRAHAAGRRMDEDFRPIFRKDTQVNGVYKELKHLTAIGESAKTVKPPVNRTADDVPVPAAVASPSAEESL